MNDEIIEQYREAGRLAKRILADGAARITPGVLISDIADSICSMVTDAGAGIAFPPNISINEAAAHDTAGPGDERIFQEGDLVKLDIGIHIDGYIADTAVSIDLGDHGKLIEASRAALDTAISLARPGATAGAIGAAVQETITMRGYQPVANLTGHGLDRFSLHAAPSIPNIGSSGGPLLKEGMVIAIEPFASTGTGRVSEGNRCEIFSQIAIKPVRPPAARRILEEIKDRRGLPFARRWLKTSRADLALTTLIRQGIIRPYPVLQDIPGSLVSQAEHTIIVTEDGCIVTTR
ncbi:methionine aminopeptidase [Methanocalculus chunghsingensis]|uniref:Methionine aminopeptidase n=1 Tax=Methanocalculus chunghsingensis TaxID=156457 RepID=A0A8J7W9R5_9EURY|nr:type II methionyl aminopeptidase [Methanocalculus chunghsingensis]MBR1369002.1 methionine aminopeptidase [Methanocalculus chunghsingensis]